MNDAFLDEVKAYVGFTAGDGAALAAMRPLLEREAERVIDVFYDRILNHPRASRSITGGLEQVGRLKKTLRKWLVELADGEYGQDYLDRRALIGRRHVQIELPQVFMVTAIDLVRCELAKAIRRELENDRARRERTLDALHKILDIDLAIMLETYQEDTLAKIERSRYALMVERAPLGIALVQDGRFVVLNERFARVFALGDTAPLIGERLGDVWREGDRERAREAFEADPHESMSTFELRDVRRADGQKIDVLCTRSALELDGRPAFQLIVRDVTDENRLSRELEEARTQVEEKRRLAALGEMVANIAHEIRNPLQGVAWGVKELKSAGVGKTAATAESCEKIDRGIRETNAIISQVLDFARPMRADRIRFATDDLVEAVREELVATAESAALKLVVERDHAPREVWVDAVKVKQALANLVRNAIEASPKGATVTLRSEKGIGGPDAVTFVVDDEGSGIPGDLGDKIFLPFVTTKVKGTGLGLAIVRRIAEIHGGTIKLEKREPRGTRARLELPGGPPSG